MSNNQLVIGNTQQTNVSVNDDEVQEWKDAFFALIRHAGKEKAAHILSTLHHIAIAEELNIGRLNTPYANTIDAVHEPHLPGDLHLERRIRALIRWNALAMVLRANKVDDLGGHLSTFASSATLYDVAFNHFFKGHTDARLGDLIFFQGHSAPGIYARSFLEGRLSEEQLNNFRREVGGAGLSSYPHPYLMPTYWQFPTVSMGLGPIMSIYQAHIQKYLYSRGLLEETDRKIWAFLGDGEMDEPESLGAIALAGREQLNNLIWVVNCNLQRLDGPVRGSGKIIQELESVFRGAGWHVIKVVWGRGWDRLLKKDTTGLLIKRMGEVVDGEYQAYKVKGGAYIRQHFFGKYPPLLELVSDMTDDDIVALSRGGHDPYKIYAAYAQAVKQTQTPTVILAKTVKGYGLSSGIEAVNKTHQIKKMSIEGLKYVRDRFAIPITDEQLETTPFYRPAEDSPEIRYLKARRAALGGEVPSRSNQHIPLNVPPLTAFQSVLQSSEDKAYSTTMMMVKILSIMLGDADIGKRTVPIVPDEARTFGLEGMFKKLGIYSRAGQLYTPEDSEQLLGYREAVDGHMLEEGINEAGATSAWIALGTSYSTNRLPMIPVYMFYSMFGFQRVGDLMWAAGDAQAQGFYIGATAGRTTLNGEGLQHQDGHSHVLAATIPNCVSYDPAFGYELAVIVQHGLERMYAQGERVFYYITVMNENYTHPGLDIQDSATLEGIRKGAYVLDYDVQAGINLLGSGALLKEVMRAQQLLLTEFNLRANVWSVTSYSELAREAAYAHKHQQQPYITELTGRILKAQYEAAHAHKNTIEPQMFLAVTDYMRLVPEQIRAYLPDGVPYITLGTDGFGRSDTRANLRGFFGVSAEHIVLEVLTQLMHEGAVEPRLVKDARMQFELDSNFD